MKKKAFLLIICVLVALLFIGCDNNYNYSDVNNTSENVVSSTSKTYDVVSVHCYVQNETNGYGAITSSHKAYVFTYIDNGKLVDVCDFENLEYGTTRVQIGDKNQYVLESYCRILYLTKETLENMEFQSEER